VLIGVLVALILPSAAYPKTDPGESHPDINLFFWAASQDDTKAEPALAALAEAWRDDYAALIVDIARFMQPRRRQTLSAPSFSGGGIGQPGDSGRGGLGEGETVGTSGAGTLPSSPGNRAPEHPTTRIRERLIEFLERQTDENFGDDLQKWRRWYWSRPYSPHPDYANFKAALYRQVDEQMADFFPAGGNELIRLDEVDWGGVGVNGIPPLDHPKHVTATEADYLKDKHVVFGLEVDGQARAYPKRILAWHEMALDELGGVELAIVYCTLCGTVIPYVSDVDGRHFTFGTSGLLYRSNKLMFDAETMSLWSTVEGKPVLGELAGSQLELMPYPVVTTTWRDWKRFHPDTTVLSLDTGYERDYSEGAAYKDYFRTDRLMFAVPARDDRLDNKDEVLALALRPAGAESDAPRIALAISAKFLKKKRNRIFHTRFAGRDLVVVTSADGANRVYDAGGARFVRADGEQLRDADGATWRVTEDALLPEAGTGQAKPRIAARRAFWFGWYAQYPQTELVK
jgi:hypothetical protein